MFQQLNIRFLFVEFPTHFILEFIRFVLIELKTHLTKQRSSLFISEDFGWLASEKDTRFMWRDK